MENSILKSTKKVLNIAPDYEAFDLDILTYINAVFSTLHQLGVGPSTGFSIEDDTAVWEDFLTDSVQIQTVKTYIYLRVRLLFDPPTTSYHMNAAQEQIKELEWRLSVHRENIEWEDPMPEVVADE